MAQRQPGEVVGRSHADADLGNLQITGFAAHQDVAGQREGRAAIDCKALEADQQHLAGRGKCDMDLAPAGFEARHPVGRGYRSEGGQVEARAQRAAGAAQHRRVDRGIGLDRLQRSEQALGERAIDCIAPRRTVEHDFGPTLVAMEQYGGFIGQGGFGRRNSCFGHGLSLAG